MNVLIVEDEQAAVNRLQKLLGEIDGSIKTVGITASIAETMAWLRDHAAPDLAFFDVQLADGDSFQVFRHTEVDCPVVFTTAFDEHALKAFKVNALDYLLKPLKKEELESALERFKQLRTVRDLRELGTVGPTATATATPIKRFLIRYGDHFKVVEPDQIAYIHSLAKNTFLRTREGRDLPLDESLDRLEPQLDPNKFFRINRQVIVQFPAIKELLAYSKSRVKVIMEPPYGEDAVVSSERSAEFKRWLAG
ncbi:MAG: response regulator transcription factor [Flavobacteriales bacterium]|nr:MAG: response regulator transcription factor [Flavobacteriales bacterium]